MLAVRAEHAGVSSPLSLAARAGRYRNRQRKPLEIAPPITRRVAGPSVVRGCVAMVQQDCTLFSAPHRSRTGTLCEWSEAPVAVPGVTHRGIGDGGVCAVRQGPVTDAPLGGTEVACQRRSETRCTGGLALARQIGRFREMTSKRATITR